MNRHLFFALFAGLAAVGLEAPVVAATVTVEVSGVHSATGQVLVGLCGDRAAAFPGSCLTHYGNAVAAEGMTRVVLEGVPDGTYALQAFHDENGNSRPEIPPEGYAFGNEVAYPPTFETAAVIVAGDTTARLKMTYISGGPSAANRPAPIEQGVAAPEGVTRVDLRADGLYGALYVPEGAKHAPALLLIGGSEGGLDTISQMATSFAKEGFVALALAYWRAPGLPNTLENIPLEYFDRGIAWLQARPEVAGNRVGMLGWSRGAEAALLVGTRNRAIAAVVAVAPSSAVWQGISYQQRPSDSAWTVKGSAIPALAAGEYRAGAPLVGMFTSVFAEVDRRADAAIPVERAHAGILLISGGDDQIWPATRFADRIMARLQANRFGENYMHLDYPAAGHAVFAGAPGGSFARTFAQPNPMLGGTAAANAAAWADSWPRTVAFLRTELQGVRR